jgi:ribosomal protein S18 acetylase RimI-like enzyme
MISEDDVQFRCARATDAGWAVPLILGSAAERFAYFHRGQTDSLQAYLSDEFSRDAGLFSYSYHVAVEYRSVPVGVVSLLRSAAGPICAIWTLYHMLRCLGLPEALSVLYRRHFASGRLPPWSWTSVYMDNLYIEPHCRGRGVGKLTVLHLCRIAAAQGYHHLYCDVEARNMAARHLYKECGMQPLAVLRSAPSCPLDNFIRLCKDLREHEESKN